MAVAQKPLLLIQARNLTTGLALPAMLTDDEGTLIYFNDAAGALLGQRYEDVGQVPREEWAREYGPFDDDDRPLAADLLPLAKALRGGRPAQGRFRARLGDRGLQEVEVSALPLVEAGEYEGSLVVFWPVEDAAEGTT